MARWPLQLMSNLSTLVTGTRPARFGTQGFCRCFVPSSAVSCKRTVQIRQCGPFECPRCAGEMGRLPNSNPRSAHFVIVVGAGRVTGSLARMAQQLYRSASLSVAGSRLVLQDVKLKFTTQNAQLVS